MARLEMLKLNQSIGIQTDPGRSSALHQEQSVNYLEKEIRIILYLFFSLEIVSDGSAEEKTVFPATSTSAPHSSNLR